MNIDSDTAAKIKVSVVLPCLNEEKFISRCLDSVLAQDLPPNEWEVLCVLGPSTDRTAEILSSYSAEYKNIRVLHNLLRNTAVSFNLGIKESRGETVFTFGAHTTYSPNYFSVAYKYLQNYDCVGSVAKTEPQEDTILGRAICAVLSSPFGVGGSKMRTGLSAPTETDTASCPGYRRDVFSRIGLFNERLKHTQDMEFNRWLKRAGGKILATPEITSYYKARSRFTNFARASFVNGFWSIYPFKYSAGAPVSVRHLVPLMFVAAILSASLLSAISAWFGVLLALIAAAYSLAALLFSFGIAYERREPHQLILLPGLFFMLHFLYGLGSLIATFRVFPREV